MQLVFSKDKSVEIKCVFSIFSKFKGMQRLIYISQICFISKRSPNNEEVKVKNIFVLGNKQYSVIEHISCTRCFCVHVIIMQICAKMIIILTFEVSASRPLNTYSLDAGKLQSACGFSPEEVQGNDEI